MVRLKVSNPNDVEIPISSLSCTLELEDMVAANGVTTEPFVVPASGDHEFEVVVSTSLFKISGPVAKLIKARKKSVNYRVSGRVKVDILFVGPFSFQQKGVVTLEH
ncbi:MAG: LEA type 2 family protein [Magnetococcales bacterium]|nr:LEA type 2 family protein [Magnetococcales bacterium]